MPNIEAIQYPISAWQEGGEWKSTGIAFEDYERMNTQQRKQSGERRLPTPEWAVNDAKFRELLVNFLEERAQIRPWLRVGTLQERLQRTQKTIVERSARLKILLKELGHRYVGLKRVATTAAEHERLRKLEVQIENVDTRLRSEAQDGGAALAAAVVYHFYRVGLDSVGTGTELGIKPPHVRQVLWRLHQTAKTLEKWRQDPSTRPVPPIQSTVNACAASSEANILKHVARLEGVANDGKLPPAMWLEENGYSGSLSVLRCFPQYFKHLQLAQASRGRPKQPKPPKPPKQPKATKQPKQPKPKPEKRRGLIDVTLAAQLRTEGLSFAAIGRRFGVTAVGVYYALTRAGIHVTECRTKKNVTKRRHYSKRLPFDAAKAVALFTAGMPVADVAMHFGYARFKGQNRTRRALIKAGVYSREYRDGRKLTA